MNNAFDVWVGKDVIVLVALGKHHLNLRGTFVTERDATVFVKFGDGATIEIPTELVLAIEEGQCCDMCHDV